MLKALALLLLSVLTLSAASPYYEDLIGTNGVGVTIVGAPGQRRVHFSGSLLATKVALNASSNTLKSFIVSSDTIVSNGARSFTLATSNFLYSFINASTGGVTHAELNTASNSLRSAYLAADVASGTITSNGVVAFTMATSNTLYSLLSGGSGGSGGGGVSIAPTNIPSATSFTVNAVWQISCVALAHNATVVVSNLSLGQVDCRLIVTNTGSFTMTFPQFNAGNWENGIIPALPANRTATIIFSRPTATVTNILMRGQDMTLAVEGPSALGTNAAGTVITATNLVNVLTNNPFNAPTLAGPVSELLFSNGMTVTVSGRRATLGMDTMGSGAGGMASVETNITITGTNNIIVDFEVANIWRLFAETNFTYTLSNMPSLANWPGHGADIYFKQDTNGQRILNAYFVDNGQFVTNATTGNMQPTTNANAVDLMQVKYGWFASNALTIWQRDMQPRTAVTPFSPSNSLTLWLVADDLTGLGDNTQVGRWTNRMAALSFTNGLAGVIKSNSVVNGHAALYFDGAGFLVSELGTGWAEYVGAESATVFIVMRQRSTDHQNCVLQWISSGEQIDVYATYDDVLYWEMPNNGPSGSINAPQPILWDDNWHVLELVRGSDTSQILVDGSAAGSGTPSANFTTGDSSVAWHLGSANGGGTAFNGDIAEVLIYNDAKSSTDRTAIRNPLKTKYNIP